MRETLNLLSNRIYMLLWQSLGDFDFFILHTYPWYLQKVALKISLSKSNGVVCILSSVLTESTFHITHLSILTSLQQLFFSINFCNYVCIAKWKTKTQLLLFMPYLNCIGRSYKPLIDKCFQLSHVRAL